MPTEADKPLDFLSPRWISRYILQSIYICGDPSLAFDILLQDATPDLKRRLKREMEAEQ
jgi:hypothetical protein